MLEEQRSQAGAEPVIRRTGALLSRLAAWRAGRTVPATYRDPVTWATALVLFLAYGTLSLFRLLRLSPSSWDLGIYTEYVKQYAHLKPPVVDIRGAGFNLLGDHFQPIVALIAPFFRLFPSAATLLVAQTLLVALSVFPVSRLAREKLGTGPGRAIAIAYGLSWGLQQMIEFDFHEVAFAVPLLAFSLSALARGQLRAGVWWALPLVFVKEDQGFTVAAIGLYLIIAGLRAQSSQDSQADPDSQDSQSPDGRRWTKAGLFLLIWGFAWSFLAIGVIIPHVNPAHQYDYWGDGGVLAPNGHLTLIGLVKQLLTAWPDKLQTTVLLLLPTAFVALRSPLALIAVPSLLLRFTSTDSSFWGTLWHYDATVMPILFVAAVDALARIQGRGPALRAGARRYGAAVMLAIAVALSFHFPVSDLWNAQTYRISPHVAAAEAAMAVVPDGATVQTTLDLLAPLAARTDTFWMGTAGNPLTQYIVFDGRDSDYAPPITDVPAFIAGIYPRHTYTLIFRSGGVYVFRLMG
jgi:uncharacterized membrane protein